MATVTKMKAAVNNKNLPILGNDGNLYNYYYGRFVNKLGEYGVTPTETEKNAINVLIENGITNGWIDKVVYLLPFIGNSSEPLSGLVPLIDNVANYELEVDSVNAQAFTYNQDNTIKTLGNPSYDMPKIELPITSAAVNNAPISIFINKTRYEDEPTTVSNNAVVDLSYENNTYGRMGVMYYDSKYIITKAVRVGTSLQTPTIIDGAYMYTGKKIGAFFAYYPDSNNVKRYKRYAVIQNGNVAKDMDGLTTEIDFEINGSAVFSLSSNNVPLKNRVNMVAFFNPITVTETDIYNFSQAVFTLTTTLGR